MSIQRSIYSAATHGDATYAPIGIPAWAPSTGYAARQAVIAPDGTLQYAKVAFTSAESYSQTNWTAVAATQVAGTPGSGSKNVTTSGTRVKLTAATQPVLSAVVTAGSGNTGIVVIGDATVVAAELTRVGTALAAGDTFTISNPTDLTAWYIDAMVNGEGVSFTFTAAA